jgi:acetamidase/formamidase
VCKHLETGPSQEEHCVPSIHLSLEQRHLAWDNSLDPAAVVGPGDELTLSLADASGGQVDRHDDASAIARLDFSAINPCTGPVFVEGVAAGDDVVVEILEIATESWAWTANIPGFGLLGDDFPDPRLWISTVRDGIMTTPIGLEIPTRPMIGTIGVAPAAFGPTPLLVPTIAGGNMDIAQLGAGSTLHLPAQVAGGLLSAGDVHAVQGDGEVCGTGAETPATIRLRVSVVTPSQSSAPWYEHSIQRQETDWTCTTGIGPDLFRAARDATRRAVDLVTTRTGLEPVDAYLLLSLTGELRVSEIVDAPNWVMSMQIPTRYTLR